MALFHKSKYGALFHADSLEFLKNLPDNSIDSCITDPPYALKLFNEKWNYDVPSVELWKEVYRVLKPGAVALVFSGSRTQHKMATNIEEAGFELKDCIQYLNRPDIKQFYDSLDPEQQQAFLSLTGGNTQFWMYSNGMPKSLKIDGLIDNKLKVKRNVVGTKTKGSSPLAGNHKSGNNWNDGQKDGEFKVTEATSPLTKKWDGWTTCSLKPAYEPILMAMKPNHNSYADNAIKYGVAGINVKDTKVGDEIIISRGHAKDAGDNNKWARGVVNKPHQGRFPANIILESNNTNSATTPEEGCPVATLDSQSKYKPSKYFKNIEIDTKNPIIYIPKPAPSERAEAFKDKYIIKEQFFKPHVPTKIINQEQYNMLPDTTKQYFEIFKNNHPTQKPLELMKYLCLLTKTPTGGIVLEPFSGSGTTLVAAIETGRTYIGIEREQKYCEIAKTRIEHTVQKKETSTSN